MPDKLPTRMSFFRSPCLVALKSSTTFSFFFFRADLHDYMLVFTSHVIDHDDDGLGSKISSKYSGRTLNNVKHVCQEKKCYCFLYQFSTIFGITGNSMPSIFPPPLDFGHPFQTLDRVGARNFFQQFCSFGICKVYCFVELMDRRILARYCSA